MKKVLSLVLTLTLVLGTFSMAFAANSTASYSDVTGKNCENQVAVLQALDVVTGYPDGTYKPEGIVTRAEMATLIIKAMDLTKYASGTSSVFSDVPSTHWAAKAVAYANAAGYIKGYPDGTFKPDQTVSYNEAVTMLVRALGYKEENLIGSWPANYINQARTLRILENIDSLEGGANRGDIAIMLFNTLDKDFVTYDKDDAVQKSDDTMLKRLGATAGEGIITDTMIEDAATDISEYLGAYAKYWAIDSDDDGNKDNIVAIEETKSAFYDAKVTDLTADTPAKLVTIEIDDVEYTAKGNAVTFKYEDAEGTATDAVKLKNGKVGTVTPAETKTYKIAAKLSGKYVTEIYSISEWEATYAGQYTDAIAKKISKDDQINAANKFEINDDKEIDTTKFVLAGVDSLDAIAKDNVVYAYSVDEIITKIEVGTKVVEGTIAKMKGTSTTAELTIDGTTYKFAKTTGVTSETVKAGDVVKLTLDYAGKIYKCEKVAGKAENYAIVLDSQAYAEGTFAGSELKVDLFLADGTTKIFTGDHEVADVTGDITADHAQQGKIVKYGLDKNGVINALTVVNFADTAVGATKTVTKAGYIDGYAIADDAVILTADRVDTAGKIVTKKGTSAPYAAATSKELGTTTKANILDKALTNAMYVLDADTNKIVFIVFESGSVSKEVYGVVTEAGWSEADSVLKANLLIGAEAKAEVEVSANTQTAELVTFTTKTDNTMTVGAAVADIGANKTGKVATSTNKKVEVKDGRVYYNDGADKSKAIASDVIVYVMNKDNVWELGDVSDLDIEAADAKTVILYDTDKDEDMITYVLVK